MAIGSSSLSGAAPRDGRVSDFVDVLSVMSDPALFKQRVDQLRAATQESHFRLNALVPAEEIAAERARASDALGAKQIAAAAVAERIAKTLERAQGLVAELATTAEQRASAIINDAKATLDEAKAIRAEAEAERAQSATRLANLVNEFIDKCADAEAASAQARADASDAKSARATAEKAREDFLARINAINSIASGA